MPVTMRWHPSTGGRRQGGKGNPVCFTSAKESYWYRERSLCHHLLSKSLTWTIIKVEFEADSLHREGTL